MMVVVVFQGGGLPVRILWVWRKMRMGRVGCSIWGRSVKGKRGV